MTENLYPDNCPPRKIAHRLGLGFGSRLVLVLGLGSNQKIASEENCPQVRVKVWFRVSFGVRSCHQRCSVKKGFLGNFTKFTGKHLRQSPVFNKVAGLRPKARNFIKKETLAQVFSCEFCEISKNTFLQNTSGRLLLWGLLQFSSGAIVLEP